MRNMDFLKKYDHEIIFRRWRTILDFANPNALEQLYGMDWLSVSK